jgi:hypothetical protein
MIERRLSKTQIRIFVALARERQRLQEEFQDIAEAENEQIEMLRQKYSLPEGRYQVRSDPDGSAVIFRAPDPPAEADDGEVERPATEAADEGAHDEEVDPLIEG